MENTSFEPVASSYQVYQATEAAEAPTKEIRAIFLGSLNIGILTIVLPGDDGKAVVGLEPRGARQEDVKTGVT